MKFSFRIHYNSCVYGKRWCTSTRSMAYFPRENELVPYQRWKGGKYGEKQKSITTADVTSYNGATNAYRNRQLCHATLKSSTPLSVATP